MDKFLLFLGGGFQTWGCTPQASFIDVAKEEFFTSKELKRFTVNLEGMPKMLSDHQSPSAIFVDGRIVVNASPEFEVFTPACMSPWSPKEGQWTRVKFNCEPLRDGLHLCVVSGAIYGIG